MVAVALISLPLWTVWGVCGVHREREVGAKADPETTCEKPGSFTGILLRCQKTPSQIREKTGTETIQFKPNSEWGILEGHKAHGKPAPADHSLNLERVMERKGRFTRDMGVPRLLALITCCPFAGRLCPACAHGRSLSPCGSLLGCPHGQASSYHPEAGRRCLPRGPLICFFLPSCLCSLSLSPSKTQTSQGQNLFTAHPSRLLEAGAR